MIKQPIQWAIAKFGAPPSDRKAIYYVVVARAQKIEPPPVPDPHLNHKIISQRTFPFLHPLKHEIGAKRKSIFSPPLQEK